MLTYMFCRMSSSFLSASISCPVNTVKSLELEKKAFKKFKKQCQENLKKVNLFAFSYPIDVHFR